MNHLFGIKDKVIVLTGGYGILGRCIAKHLAREGAKVAILGRNAEKGNWLKEEVRKLGGMAMFHAADVMRREQLEESRQAIVQAFGSIDVLINLAGGNMPGATIAPDQTFFDLDLDAFRQVIDLNLFGTVLPTMVFAEVMVEQ